MAKQVDARKLVEEIGRYLAAVDLFRSEDCEPSWRLEQPADQSSYGRKVVTKVSVKRSN